MPNAILDDHARPKKTDAGYDLGRRAGRIKAQEGLRIVGTVFEGKRLGDDHHGTSADRNEQIRAQSRRTPAFLPFPTDEPTRQGSKKQLQQDRQLITSEQLGVEEHISPLGQE
jgi:hypothetical protein